MPVLNLQGVNRAPTAGRLRLVHVADSISEFRLELYDPDLTTLQSDLAGTRSRNTFDGTPGTAEFTIQNDNADVGLVLQKNLVNFFYREVLAFTMIVENLDRTQISPEEEAGEFTTVSGRGHLALLEKAIVYRALGDNSLLVERDRYFNWTSPFYDYTGWIAATEVVDVATAQSTWPVPWNAGYPDGTSQIVWASDGTVSSAGAGHCYFHQPFTTGFDFPARVFFGADNGGQLYLDGTILCDVTFNDLAVQDFPLAAGLHEIAVQCENVSGPGGAAWAIYGIDLDGNLTGLVINSNSTAKIVEYAPDAPGITVGFVLNRVLVEMQARGILSGLSWTFSETADSYGEPWPVIGNISTRVGNDVLSFFIEIAQTYMDFWMTPGMFELNAVVKDTRGTV